MRNRLRPHQRTVNSPGPKIVRRLVNSPIGQETLPRGTPRKICDAIQDLSVHTGSQLIKWRRSITYIDGAIIVSSSSSVIGIVLSEQKKSGRGDGGGRGISWTQGRV